jgi:hypothetical protein
MNTLHWRMPLMMLALLALTACAGCKEEKDEPEEEEIVLHATYDLVLWNKLYNAPVANMPVELTESNSGVTFGHMTIGYDTSDANGRIKKTVRKNTIWRNGLMLNRYDLDDIWAGRIDSNWHYKWGPLQKFEFAWPEGNPYYIDNRNWQLRDTIFVRLSSGVAFQIDALFGAQKLCVNVQNWTECQTLDINGSLPDALRFYVERYTPYTFIARLMDGTRVLQTDTIRHTTGNQFSYKKFDLVNRSKN